ncbi:MAG TPA: hypothetical protein VGK73_21165 [Polyangiaceae bacterium]
MSEPRHFSLSLARLLMGAGLSLAAWTGCSEDTGVSEEPPASGRAGSSGAGSAGSSSSAGKGGTSSGGAAGNGGKSGTAGTGTAGSSAGKAGSSGSAGSGNSAGGASAGGKSSAAGSGSGGTSSGSGGSAGAADAGETGAGGGATVSDCADLPICDDFETYDEGQAPSGIWSKQGGGSATVDTTRPHRGDKSVHIETGESEGGRVWLHTTTDRLFPTRHMFGRLWMYLDALPTTEVHWDMIEAQGTADEPEAWDDPFEIALRYGGQLDENFLANFETPGSYGGDGPRTDCAKFSETRMPAGRWSCMEWEFDSDAEVMRFWLDGEAIEDLEVHKEGTQCISDGTDGVWYYPTFESLNLGWREWWEAGTRELWIDDVAVGAARIGCD